MTDPFLEQKIQNWAAEFADSDAVRKFPAALQEHAAQLAESFLLTACRLRGINPEELSETDLKSGLLDGAGLLALPEAARAKVPDFCAAFMEMLQSQGRMQNARSLPSFVRALRAAFLANAVSAGNPYRKSQKVAKAKPIVRPGSKLGPNDPCPCGSGKKYKKCCQRLLG